MNDYLIRVQKEVDPGKAGTVQLAENTFEIAWRHGPARHHFIAGLKAYVG
ncbi:MAG: hypothetical protein VB089_02470 [Anaerolineaceae bacterium]|nr:hypothetical protein [Anaerolineaceae bacterium]